MRKPCATINSCVLAVPDLNCSTEEAFKYLDTLLEWKRVLKSGWISVNLSEKTAEFLIKDGLYPLRAHLQELIRTHRIIEYDANTVVTVANQLLSITPTFEDCFELSEILADPIETQPDLINRFSTQNQKEEIGRTISFMTFLASYGPKPLGGHSLIVRDSGAKIINVRSEVLILEHSRDDLPELHFPLLVEGELSTSTSFLELLDCLDECQILLDAAIDSELQFAIKLALIKDDISKGLNVQWYHIECPRIGGDFRELCQGCCGEQSDSLPRKILRSIVETARSRNLSDVHALRNGPGGNAPQKMRGKDKAQRRDIDYEFHLHYWHCDDNSIELASVVYHNDFFIPS